MQWRLIGTGNALAIAVQARVTSWLMKGCGYEYLEEGIPAVVHQGL
jgi:hypothetical protein